jgi:hypothetical protein
VSALRQLHLHEATNILQPHPVSVVTQFSSLEVANLSTFYHAMLIMFDQFVTSIHSLLLSRGVDVEPERETSEQTSDTVASIVMSVDYHFPFIDPTICESTAPGPRNVFLLLSLSVAHKVLTPPKSAHETCTNVARGRHINHQKPGSAVDVK